MYTISYIEGRTLKNLGECVIPVIPRIGGYVYLFLEGNNAICFKVIEVEHTFHSPIEKVERTNTGMIKWSLTHVSVFLERENR